MITHFLKWTRNFIRQSDCIMHCGRPWFTNSHYFHHFFEIFSSVLLVNMWKFVWFELADWDLVGLVLLRLFFSHLLVSINILLLLFVHSIFLKGSHSSSVDSQIVSVHKSINRWEFTHKFRTCNLFAFYICHCAWWLATHTPWRVFITFRALIHKFLIVFLISVEILAAW